MVEPTHLKNMLVKMGIFPKVRGENSKNISNHHLDKNSSKHIYLPQKNTMKHGLFNQLLSKQLHIQNTHLT